MPRRNTKLMRCFPSDLERRRQALLIDLEFGKATDRAELAKVDAAITARASEVIEFLTITAEQGRAKAQQSIERGNKAAADGWLRWVAARERRIRELEGALPEVARTMGELRLPTATQDGNGTGKRNLPTATDLICRVSIDA